MRAVGLLLAERRGSSWPSSIRCWRMDLRVLWAVAASGLGLVVGSGVVPVVLSLTLLLKNLLMLMGARATQQGAVRRQADHMTRVQAT